MGRKKKTPEELLAAEIQALEKEHRHWIYVYENGCNDPGWPDGVNLELIKNHIIYGRKKIAEYCEQLRIQPPDIYFHKLPSDVPSNYMAQAERIQATAQERIQALQELYNQAEYKPGSPFYRYFQQYKDALEKENLVKLRSFNTIDFNEVTEKSEKREHDYEETPTGQLGLYAVKPQSRRASTTPGAGKLRIEPLYQSYLSRLRDSEVWSRFLQCAAAQYKYNFENQVLIFGQFPEATCVADEMTWSKLGRGLRFQAVGIATLQIGKQGLKTETVYDISQTLGYELGQWASPERFAFTAEEGDRLNTRLQEKFHLGKTDLPRSLETLADGLAVTLWDDVEHDRYFTFVQDSSKAIVLTKFGLPFSFDFGSIEAVETSELTRLGHTIQAVSSKIIKDAEYQLKQVRSEVYELSGKERETGTDARTEPGRDGQLTFGQIRSNPPAIYAGKPQRTDVGAYDERDADAAPARPGGIPERTEAAADGGAGKAEPEAGHGELPGDHAAYELPEDAGGGAAAGGTVPAGLTNYHCTDPHQQYGGQVTKYERNIEAIRLLKQIEESGRQAGIEEQAVLARYTGWGGIPQVFNPDNVKWSERHAELKGLLSPEEYAAARASTLNAFYTPLPIVAAIHRGLLNMGFTGRHRYLEPAMGPGDFFAALPEELRDAELHGVELDSLTGRLARQLYPNADIQITGFEKTLFPDGWFDCAFGNVPFGSYPVFDERYKKLNLLIHDYFFARSIDKVAPGGVIAYITSKGTMDKADGTFRKYLAERAELIGAVRLPSNTMKQIANTEVTSDIIFLQKREPDRLRAGMGTRRPDGCRRAGQLLLPGAAGKPTRSYGV